MYRFNLATMRIMIQSNKFKNECLHLLDKVQYGNTYVITRRGRPLAELTAVMSDSKNLFGCMKGSVVENGNIIDPVGVCWEAENG
ncbi:hypothetical protein FACS1894152_7360 [Bacilli bacterium]|nr:hypothetical protein FACS1894152_7360 [Bacilli bacterium]